MGVPHRCACVRDTIAFSVGVDALGATINSRDVANGRFFAWLGQFQFVRQLPVLDTQLIARTDL